MTKPPDKPEPFLLDMKASTNLAYFLATIHAMCFFPMLHTDFGVRGFGLAGFCAFLLQWFWGGLYNAPEMVAYSCVWLAFVVYRRATADPTELTEFQGYPVISPLFKTYLAARLAEAALMLPLGALIGQFSQPLGQFVTFGTLSLGVKYAFDASIQRRREEAIGDAGVMAEIQRRHMEQAGRKKR